MSDILHTSFHGIFEKKLIEEIIQEAQIITFQEGDVLIRIGQYIKTMPLIVEGAIKVMREDGDAGELLLYFIGKGETCAMSLACCVGYKQSEIRAIAETDGVVAMIPVHKMEEWLGKYKSWRNYVFESYNNRLNEMLEAIDNIAFMKMDERLYNYLLEKSRVNHSTLIAKTHQEIAYELNTSRVVVSRLLKAFERQGAIKLNRNSIELLTAK